MAKVIKIISGGQTGADQAGLDAAISMGIPHGGWCPKFRRSENGRIPDKYNLQETPGSLYPERTIRNVIDSDATLIFNLISSPGTNTTVRTCRDNNKPFIIVSTREPELIDEQIYTWLKSLPGEIVLNVAGHRESKFPTIYSMVHGALCRVIPTLQG